MRVWIVRGVLAALALTGLVWLLGAGPEQAFPPAPVIYQGLALVNGAPAPAGLEVFARVLDYQSNKAQPEKQAPLPVLVKSGAYNLLTVGPGEQYANQQITFYLTNGFAEVKATETEIFQASGFPQIKQLDLHFSALPAPPPTPTPTPTPTPLPAPTVTPTPTPLLPIPGDPSVRSASHIVLVAGVAVFALGLGLVMLARRRAF